MVEIERKFLVDTKIWKANAKGTSMKQGYLSVDPERTVRVRIAGNKAFLTIKGKTSGIKRTELEYQIPLSEAKILLDLCLDFKVEKTRYVQQIDNLIWEVDIFEGGNSGLVLAEVELQDENQEVNIPKWVIKEVSGDNRYYNSWLSQHPFTKW